MYIPAFTSYTYIYNIGKYNYIIRNYLSKQIINNMEITKGMEKGKT